MSRCYCVDGYTCVTCALRRDRQGRRRDMVRVAVLLLVMAGVLGWAQAARATTPPCQVIGHLEAAPGHVTAVFTVAETCAEVSVVSWLAPDAHAGQPQTLYDRHAQSDVAPGDYRWTITAPPEGCFVQDDLVLPGGYTIDFILGGGHVCQPSTPTTTTTAPTTTTSTSVPTSTTSQPPIATLVTATPPSTSATIAGRTQSTPTEELAFSGGGEVGLLALMAVGFIGFGRWVEWRGKKRAAR